MSQFDYKRYGHIDGVLTPWIWRIVCTCGFETEWVPQAAGAGTPEAMDARRAAHDAECPGPRIRVCDCGATPDPSEGPTTGNYVENGVAKYICLRCWERENGSDGGTLPT